MKNNTLPTPPLTQYHANYNFKTKMKPDNLSPQYKPFWRTYIRGLKRCSL